jgi:hypothetical protein
MFKPQPMSANSEMPECLRSIQAAIVELKNELRSANEQIRLIRSEIGALTQQNQSPASQEIVQTHPGQATAQTPPEQATALSARRRFTIQRNIGRRVSRFVTLRGSKVVSRCFWKNF